MSNLAQFQGKAFPLGSVLTMTYMGDLVVANDGTEWICGTTTAPFAYTSGYSATPTNLLMPYAIFPGPWDGKWFTQTSSSLAYKSSGTLYCTGNREGSASIVEGDATNGYIYYTTIDDGVTWTRRTFPNLKPYTVAYTAGKFIGFTINSTTTAIITSTDAATWTSYTGVSQANVSDIVSNGSTQIVAFPQSGTVANVSVDSGATWALATITSPTAATATLNSGYCTWNAGAGLFIGNVGVAGQYQTSPTGATWTLRSTQATFQPYGVFFTYSCKFASNATLTVAIGTYGFFATTIDGLTWSNHGWITSGTAPINSINSLYYDGTRFVALSTERIFYSTNGTTWVEGRRAFGTANQMLIANDRHVRMPIANILGKALLVTDPTVTTPLTVSPLYTGSTPNTANNYTRIK
jgi:hypothetical protein